MSITTYAELRTAIADFLDRSDLSAKLPDFVRLATTTANKFMRDRRMVATANPAITANIRYATAPGDLIEPVLAMVATDEDYPIALVSPEEIVRLRRTRFRSTGYPRYYAVVGDRLELAPTPSVTGHVELSYYQEIPPLVTDGDSNWLLADEPDIYLYASILHAAIYLHDGELVQRMLTLLPEEFGAAVRTAARVAKEAAA